MKNFWKYAMISIITVILIPFIIDICYEVGDKLKYSYMTYYTASDILAFYGALLTGALTIIGVFLTVKHSQKGYKEDMVNRVMPFLTVNALSNSYYGDVHIDAILNADIENAENEKYKIHETDYKSIYFIISNKIEIEYSLSELDRKSYMMSKRKTSTGKGLAIEKSNRIYRALHIINSGNGPAVSLSISIRKLNEKDSEVSAVALSLHVGEKIYIAFCVNNENNIASGDYILHYSYKDIYQNKYDKIQNIAFGKDDVIIDLEIQ